MRKLKGTKKITYRQGNAYNPYPCIIFEGKWITKKYGLKAGDTIEVQYGDKTIILKMEPILNKEEKERK